MTSLDRLILWSCGLVIVASAAIGTALTARQPEVEPWVKDGEEWFRRERMTIKDPPPARAPIRDAWSRTGAGRERGDSSAMYLMPPIPEVPKPPLREVTLEIEPSAAPAVASAGLDGVTISWTLEDPPVALEPHEKRKRAKVTGFAIERSRDGSPFEKVTEAGPEARSWPDRTAEPRSTLRYRVLVNGAREILACGSCGREIGIPRELTTAEARTPSPFRVKLVGGDARIGIFRVEAYDRSARAWKGANHSARPGGTIGPSGWRLASLTFEKSSLTAEAVDDGGVTRKMSTQD
jgi:hypothetical protein